MVKYCTRLCGQGRDRRLVVEREVVHFIRGLMQFVYPSSVIPAAYDVTALLKQVDLECADVDADVYRLHFGQYFRFDISTQLPYFYKSVQKLLVGLCTGLTRMWQRVWAEYFSLTPFDPDLIHSGSDDRRTDALVETCAVLTDRGLLDLDYAGAVQQEYMEVTQYFKKRWSTELELGFFWLGSLACRLRGLVGWLIVVLRLFEFTAEFAVFIGGLLVIWYISVSRCTWYPVCAIPCGMSDLATNLASLELYRGFSVSCCWALLFPGWGRCCDFFVIPLALSLRRLRHSIHLWPSMLQYLQFPSNLRLTSLVAFFLVLLWLGADWELFCFGW